MERLDTAPMRGAANVLIVLGAVIWLATAIWCVVAWGAFRRAFAATRWQAWLATSLLDRAARRDRLVALAARMTLLALQAMADEMEREKARSSRNVAPAGAESRVYG